MSGFTYRAYLASGTVEEGTIEATSKLEAIRALQGQNKKPFEIRATKSLRFGLRHLLDGLRTRRMELGLTQLFTEVSVLLQSGFTIDYALRLIAASERHDKKKAGIEHLRSLLAQGKSVAQAFSSLANVPPHVTAAISAGESSGKLPVIFLRLAESFQERTKQRRQIIEAILYPAFLAVMLLFALLVLSLFLVPALEPIFEAAATKKPLLLAILSDLGSFIREAPEIILLLLTTGILGSIHVCRNKRAKELISTFLLRLPLIGQTIRKAATARYLGTLALLLGNGVTMATALKLSADVSGIPDIRERLEAVRSAVSSGSRLRPALEESGIADATVLSLIGIGEESNDLPAVLDRASKLMDEKVRRTIEGGLKLMTPFMTILMGLLVGGLVITVMTTLLSINELALQ